MDAIDGVNTPNAHYLKKIAGCPLVSLSPFQASWSGRRLKREVKAALYVLRSLKPSNPQTDRLKCISINDHVFIRHAGVPIARDQKATLSPSLLVTIFLYVCVA